MFRKERRRFASRCGKQARGTRRLLRNERLESRTCLAAAIGLSDLDAQLVLSPEAEPIAAEGSAFEHRTESESVDDQSESATALQTLTNRVSFAGEGIGTLRVSPTGDLGQLFYLDYDQLNYRYRSPTGEFVEELITEVEGYSWLSSTRGTPAQLLYRSDGSPIVLIAQEHGFLEYQRDASGTWAQANSVSYAPEIPFELTGHLLAEVGPDDAIHVIVTAGDWYYGRMLYATNQSGQWAISEIVEPAASGPYYHFEALDSRYVSMAVDPSDGSVHVSFAPEFLDFGEGGFRRPWDQLAYVSNRSGTWTTEIVHQPRDDSGQSGLASSIAIAPDGQPAIASFFVDRYQTGSAVASQLLFHRRNSDGNWISEVVADRADGYVAGDGAKFTGFAPHLVFDAIGRPHIAFSDHASEHFPQFGAEEFAGQIRHAVKQTGQWSINTVFAQQNPLRSMMAFPTMAILPHEVIFVGLQRISELDENLFVTNIAYNYVESIVPQTGLTISVAERSVSASGAIELVLRRHHGDFSLGTTVLVSGSDPLRIESQTFEIPTGVDQITVELSIKDGTAIATPETLTLTASAIGFYPASTIVSIQPVDLKWHNTDQPHDANRDQVVSPRDALFIINWIATILAGGDPNREAVPRYPDVNADGKVSPIDALVVINYLARSEFDQGTEAEDGEGDSMRSVVAPMLGSRLSATTEADEAEEDRRLF